MGRAAPPLEAGAFGKRLSLWGKNVGIPLKKTPTATEGKKGTSGTGKMARAEERCYLLPGGEHLERCETIPKNAPSRGGKNRLRVKRSAASS